MEKLFGDYCNRTMREDVGLNKEKTLQQMLQWTPRAGGPIEDTAEV